jgi:hypothetical protein
VLATALAAGLLPALRLSVAHRTCPRIAPSTPGNALTFSSTRSANLSPLAASFVDGVRLAVPGLAVVALAAAGTTVAMESMLLGVAPLSPVAFGLTGLPVLAVVLLACAVPAARAPAADPAAALRAR